MDNIFQNWPQFRIHPPADDLLQKLVNLREATSSNECARHSKKIVDKTILMIGTQNYSLHVYSMCHLLSALSASGVTFENLYQFTGTISKNTVEHLLNQNPSTSSILIQAKSIEFKDNHGKVWFAYSLSQAPLSLCLFDFLIEIIDPVQMQKHYEFLGNKPKQNDIKSISNEISRDMYAYLKDRLPTSSAQDRADLFTNYVKTLSQENQTTRHLSELIADDMIFDFWDLNKHDEKLRLKLYSSCVFSWAMFRDALSSSHQLAFEPIEDLNGTDDPKLTEVDRVTHRRWIEREQALAGQTEFFQPCLTSASFDFVCNKENESPLTLLEEVSAKKLKTIKLLNKKEIGKIEPLCQLGRQAGFILKSEFRLSTFSPTQFQLVEKKRKNHSTQPVLEGMMKIPNEQYLQHRREVERLAITCEELAFTSACRLIETGYHFGLTTLLEASQGEDRNRLERFLKEQSKILEGKHVSTKEAEVYAEKILKIIPKELPEIAKKMKDNFQKYRRSGLNRRKSQHEDDFSLWSEEIIRSVPKLIKISNFIKNVFENSLLTEEEDRLAQLTAEDKQIFFKSFNSLYGEIDEYKQS